MDVVFTKQLIFSVAKGNTWHYQDDTAETVVLADTLPDMFLMVLLLSSLRVMLLCAVTALLSVYRLLERV